MYLFSTKVTLTNLV